MSKFLCVVIFLTTIILDGNCSSTNKKCVLQNSCQCRLSEYSIINISTVLDGNPYLEDTLGNITYYFLGCEDKELKINPGIKGSLIKAITYFNNSSKSIDRNYTIIGNASSIKFEYEEKHKNFLLVYNETISNTTAVPSIRFFCDEYDRPLLKIISADANELVLASSRVCVINEPHGLSGGTIFLIILFVSSGIYFFGGAVFLYFIRGARDIEIIPNIDFWRNLPGLVRDGAIFLLSGCKPTFISTAETYDRI